MHRFELISESDPKQALRIRRFFTSAATSLVVIFLLFICYTLGLLEYDLVLESTLAILFFMLVFLLLLRSGLNLRFPDPSLTTEQILIATLTMLYVMYHAGHVRAVLMPLYLIPFLFGVFRLGAKPLLWVGLVVVLAYVQMIGLLAWFEPETFNVRTEIAELAVLATAVLWFGLMGGQLHGMRRRLADSELQLREALEQINVIASRDELTGAFNRRSMMDALAREKNRAERSRKPFSLCMLDLDHLKKINDELGHDAGDEALRVFAGAVQRKLRTGDVFGRFGGEEFLLVFPETDSEGAVIGAERIRAAIEDAAVSIPLAGRKVTATIGIATFESGEDLSRLLSRAEEALYLGKAGGRNRVVSAGRPALVETRSKAA